MITNAGTDRNSVCWEEHTHAVKVATGEVEDDESFSFVCSLDDADDPLEDPSCWVKANPLLNVTITEEWRRACRPVTPAVRLLLWATCRLVSRLATKRVLRLQVQSSPEGINAAICR